MSSPALQRDKSAKAAEPATRPEWLVRLADSSARIGFVIGLLVLIVVPLGATTLWLLDKGSRPIRKVVVTSPLLHTPRQQVTAAVNEYLESGYIGLDIEALRDSLEAIPWIESVDIKRRWPDGLELGLIERVPVARWGATALVTASGERFTPRAASVPEDLPQLYGPQEGVSRVLAQSQRFGELLGVVGLRAEGVALDSRGAWRVTLDNGLELLLGRHRMEQRLWRLARVYRDVVKPRLADIAQVDLRYSNGFAVRWHIVSNT